MKASTNILAAANEAHKDSQHPTVAVISRSIQALMDNGSVVATGAGMSTYEAINSAVVKADKMKDWVVLVSSVGADGSHVMPQTLDRMVMNDFRRLGLHAVLYLAADGELDIYTPTR